MRAPSTSDVPHNTHTHTLTNSSFQLHPYMSGALGFSVYVLCCKGVFVLIWFSGSSCARANAFTFTSISFGRAFWLLPGPANVCLISADGLVIVLSHSRQTLIWNNNRNNEKMCKEAKMKQTKTTGAEQRSIRNRQKSAVISFIYWMNRNHRTDWLTGRPIDDRLTEYEWSHY